MSGGAVVLSRSELELLLEALDSHAYWQLSDTEYRSNGAVLGDGSNDPETRGELQAVEALTTRLSLVLAAMPTARGAK